jgi:hypothetical protein
MEVWILVELPGAKDVDRIKNYYKVRLNWVWETYKIEEMGNFLMAETLKKTEVTTVRKQSQ